MPGKEVSVARESSRSAQRSLKGSSQRPIVVVGTGALVRVVMRKITDDQAYHGVHVGVDAASESLSSCALAAEIPQRATLFYVPNFDDWAAAISAGPHRRERILSLTEKTLEAARLAGVEHLVVVTTAMVYGAASRQPLLDDEAPLMAPDDDGLVGDALAVERVVRHTFAQWKALVGTDDVPDLTIMRPAALVGPGVDTAVSRHFEAPRLLVLRNTAASWQFAHIEDVAGALLHSVEQSLVGPVNVGCPGTIDQVTTERLTGMRRVEVPESMAMATAEKLRQVGALPMPATDVYYVTQSWAVSSRKLRESGWRSGYANEECLDVLMEQTRGHHAVAGRRFKGKDVAALSAAGAAVALLGTAAVWRQARGGRRH